MNDGEAWHLRATLLPEGDEPVDLWVSEGRLSFEPRPDARELAPPGGFIVPGLVDSHTHLGFSDEAGGEVLSPEQVQERCRAHLRAGTTFIREMGGTSPVAVSLPTDDRLPRMQAAGTCLILEHRHPFSPTPPEQLAEVAAAQIEAGGEWVKIFADWPGWPDDDGEPEFGSDHLSYDRDVLGATADAVHAAGGRVAIHAFGPEGAQAAVAAGVDSIEHGWGLKESELDEMAKRSIAWVPLLGIAPMMLSGAEKRGDRAQAEWIRASRERLRELLPRAVDAGVPVLAGTDWFPEVRLLDDMQAMVECGLSVERAIGATSTTAKRFLGEPGLEEGAPADFVLLRSDPRADLAAIANPEVVMLAGRRVEGSA